MLTQSGTLSLAQLRVLGALCEPGFHTVLDVGAATHLCSAAVRLELTQLEARGLAGRQDGRLKWAATELGHAEAHRLEMRTGESAAA